MSLGDDVKIHPVCVFLKKRPMLSKQSSNFPGLNFLKTGSVVFVISQCPKVDFRRYSNVCRKIPK